MDRLLERPPPQRERRAVGRGRAAEVSFTVSSAYMTQVGIVAVVLTTLLAFAVGSGLLALAARRSRRWVRAVLIAAALVAVVSGGAPLSAAQDTATGIPAWLGRLLAGEFVVTQMTSWRGSSNEKAKKELGWEPRYPSWREGFRAWVSG